MEMLQLFNKDGFPLNKSIARGSADFKEGEYIKLATIWIKSKGKYLIQKCSKQKGGEFAVSGGHVQEGKTSKDQAVLELKEELNLQVAKNKLEFLGNIYRPHAIFDIFLCVDDAFIGKNFDLQKEEVEEIVWLSKPEIISLIEDGKFRATSAEQFEKFIAGN